METVADFYHRVYDGATPEGIAENVRSVCRQRCSVRAGLKGAITYLGETVHKK